MFNNTNVKKIHKIDILFKFNEVLGRIHQFILNTNKNVLNILRKKYEF